MKEYYSFHHACILFTKFLLILFWSLVPIVNAALMADEYTVRGTVISILCDTYGNPRTGELSPGLSASNACEFVWYRKNEKWRLDIKEPVPPFTQGVWKSVMPFTERELIFITSCPPAQDDPKAGGNAIVKVVSNQFLNAESIFGAHAVWLSHNLDQVLALIGPSKKCPPFWDYDPAIHALQVNSHEIRQTNGSVLFWNPGHYFARDSNQRIVFEAGQPKLLPYPLLADSGFTEAQLRPSPGFRDETRRIPNYTELMYWVPFKDETKSDGVRMAMVSKLIVNNHSVDVLPISESVFLPSWTNTFATVFDFREKSADNQPLSYITKAKTISPKAEELIKRKKFDEKVRASAQASKRSSDRPSTMLPRVLLLLIFCSLPLGLWFVFKRDR